MMEVYRNLCAACDCEVTESRAAMRCDNCLQWQHLECGMDITLENCYKLVGDYLGVGWKCSVCNIGCMVPPSVISSSNRSRTQPMDRQSEVGPSVLESRSPSPVLSSNSLQLEDITIEEEVVECTVISQNEVLDYTSISQNEVMESTGCGEDGVMENTNISLDEVIESSNVSQDEVSKSSMSDTSDSQMNSDLPAADQTTYKILSNATQKGRVMLFDSNGYAYTLKTTNKDGSKLWRCKYRGKCPCPATVQQREGNFGKGLRPHNHPGLAGAYEDALISSETKTEAIKAPFKSASQIAKAVMKRCIADKKQPLDAVRPIHRIARNANHARRPKEPQTTDFELDLANLPRNFMVADISKYGARHLIFGTKEQLAMLKESRVWYVDATFEIVRNPFVQLFSIHAFVRSGETAMQFPLAFILMSSRRARDYKVAIGRLVSVLGVTKVTRVVCNYEVAIWKAFSNVLPRIDIRGCGFHFTQAIYCKIKELGLAPAFRKRGVVCKVLRELMGLCYLPGSLIQPTFLRMRRKHSDPKLVRLFEYIQDVWIYNANWSTSNCSVYQTAVRTRNDVEGWHNRLHLQGRENMPLHLLVSVLHDESHLPEGRIRLLSEDKVKKRRRKSRQGDARLYKLWKKFENGNISYSKLLRKIAKEVYPS